MNLRDFSLLKEDDTSYQIGHPKGKSMTVPKAGLSDKAQKLIQSLKREQGLAEGGETELLPSPIPTNSESAVDSPENIVADAQTQMPLPQMTAVDEQAAAKQDQPDVNLPESHVTAPVAQDVSPNKALVTNEGLESAKAATEKGTQAEAKAAQQEAGAYGEAAQQLSQERTPEQIFQGAQQKDQELQSAYMSEKIDPNRYINNLGTGSKIASGIAMILGGLGSGLTHQANPAVQFINEAINRDIESQKNDQSKAFNLWKMNRESTGNDASATLATQNQLLGIAKVKALQAQAGAQGGLAQQRAAQAVLGFDQQIQQNNRYRALLETGPNGLAGTDPAQLVPLVSKDPTQQKAIYEEIGRAQNVSQNRQKLLNYFDQSANDNTVLRTGAGLLRTPGSVMALHQTMLPNFKQVDGTVRQAAMDETFHNITPSPGDTDAKIALKRQALNDWMQSETAAPVAKGAGIDLEKFNSTKGQRNVQKPGSVVSVRGKNYQVGPDGDTLTPL